MLERQAINGRQATVAYLAKDFTFTDKDKAELVKVTFDDDNSTLWLTPASK